MAQFPRMNLSLPPSIRADLLVLWRSGGLALVRVVVAPALLVVGSAVLASMAQHPGFGWCLPVAAAFALLGAWALAQGRLSGALARAYSGWCGGLPLRAAATRRALIMLTFAALLAAVLGISSILLAVATIRHSMFPDFSVLAVNGGLVVGTVAAVVQVMRPGARTRLRGAQGVRESAFALRWLDDARLPHLIDWQRRAGLVKWRSGGFAMVACVLVAVPHGAAIPGVVALILLAGSLAWLEVVMRSSAGVAASATGLLRATPFAAQRMCRASLRYPLFATIVAAFFAVIGAILPGGAPTPLIIWLACALAVAAWPLYRIGRITAASGPYA